MSKETREQKAQRLVDSGRIRALNFQAHGVYAVVHGDHDRYLTIIVDSGSYFCTCRYGQMHSHTTDRCSHALAVALAAEKETA